MKRRDFIKRSGALGLLGALGGLTACDLNFEYSQYDVDVPHRYRHLTKRNIDKLAQMNQNKNKFKFAFITDTHTFYNELEDAIPSINAQKDIDFVLHGGDLTLSALNKEFIWFNEIMDDLDYPFLTVIGNHDFLSNGEQIYNLSFGPNNYTFTYCGCKFVMFDNTVWERKNTLPDFDWLDKNLSKDDAKLVIPVSHIPPWNSQFKENETKLFNGILEKNKIKLSIHGHTHSYYRGKKFDNVDYLVGGDIADKTYQIVTVENDQYSIENINF
jgi:3',5'-cyclic AMP phosphodiesterase CpdA